MLKKSITYIDFNGESRTEDFYFNLTQAECMEMELSTSGGIQGFVNQIVSEKDSKKIIELFKEMILKAYGVKSPDGKYFRKSPEISKDFESTEAYSTLFMELATNSEAAASFMRGVLPERVQQASNNVTALNP